MLPSPNKDGRHEVRGAPLCGAMPDTNQPIHSHNVNNKIIALSYSILRMLVLWHRIENISWQEGASWKSLASFNCFLKFYLGNSKHKFWENSTFSHILYPHWLSLARSLPRKWNQMCLIVSRNTKLKAANLRTWWIEIQTEEEDTLVRVSKQHAWYM